MKNRVYRYIVDKLSQGEKLHFTLVDPDKAGNLDKLEELADLAASAGSDLFLIGGSTSVTPEEAGIVADTLKKTGLPVVIFPGNINCLTPRADAVLFMVLMNTLEPYYLMQVQVLAAPLIRKYGLETIPTGYIVFNMDTAVGHVGRVYPIPYSKPELALAYGLAAEMMGFKLLYLEAGSGAPSPIPPVFPQVIKRNTGLITMVGGGIRSPEAVVELLKAGADIIVTGTVMERDPVKGVEVVKAVKSYRGRDTSS
ncbi:geranylgeranylglyceryl/heptaprenylglyceryl phosphate synthase [Desulfurococcus mucosus]|uniref:Geranylgeranylglyceryl phosphate synthase n=1 Tax=Desulfurococcus mucosus (strain ATCC 35584 / DSM 2162 / JCM 9187 / O7/1) TaxID=765177 RepID=E8RAQ6_DESM0|nr:geranylgeranylglyceryl/heptaprenylglyceryl phosphate synthase [Desulfurococcus mucosus]ADV65492.1 geranylgeranylglyceryl diphosphate synthase [Desulfurococcus mucosus DSM 2162]